MIKIISIAILSFLFIGCNSVDEVRKKDCYDLTFNDLNADLGIDAIQLWVHDIRTDEKGKEYILFRQVKDFKGFVNPVKETSFKMFESSGLIWMWTKDFKRMRYKKGSGIGFVMFSYPEKIRDGVECNEIRNGYGKQKTD